MTRAIRWLRLAAATAVLATASIGGEATAIAPAEAGAAQPRTLVVPTGYPSIQAAVDAATAGDRIVVRSGTFTEQVSIGKDLTITGSGSTVIRAPGSLAVGALGQTSILELRAGATLHLSNLAVSCPGAGICEDGALWAGIHAADGATLDAERIRVTKIRDARLNDCFRSGNGIVVGDVESPATARIRHSTIDSYQAAGVVVIGPDSRADVVDDIVQGPGRTPLAATGGIEFVVGATGSAERNIVSGNACGSADLGCGPDWFNQFQVAGISADGPGTFIRDNLLVGNQVGIYTGPVGA